MSVILASSAANYLEVTRETAPDNYLLDMYIRNCDKNDLLELENKVKLSMKGYLR